MSAAVITACSKAREHEMKTMAQGEKTPNHITQSPVLLALSHSVVPSLSQATSVVASCGWWQGAGIIFAFRPWCVYVLQLLKVVFACVSMWMYLIDGPAPQLGTDDYESYERLIVLFGFVPSGFLAARTACCLCWLKYR